VGWEQRRPGITNVACYTLLSVRLVPVFAGKKRENTFLCYLSAGFDGSFALVSTCTYTVGVGFWLVHVQ